MKCAKLFQKNLDSKKLNYQASTDKDGDIRIRFPYEGKDILMFFSGNDGEYLSMYTVFEHVPQDKRIALLETCNDLNCQYKWVTFYVDKDNDIVLHCDAKLSVKTADEEAFELLIRNAKIMAEVKPILMKAIYA